MFLKKINLILWKIDNELFLIKFGQKNQYCESWNQMLMEKSCENLKLIVFPQYITTLFNFANHEKKSVFGMAFFMQKPLSLSTN